MTMDKYDLYRDAVVQELYRLGHAEAEVNKMMKSLYNKMIEIWYYYHNAETLALMIADSYKKIELWKLIDGKVKGME